MCKSLDIVTPSGCLSHKLYNEISEENAGILEIKCTFHKINYCSISSSYLCVLYFNLQNSFKKTQTGMCNQIKYCTVYQCTVYTDVLYCQQYLYCTVHTAGKLYELSVGKGRGPVLEYRYAEKYHEQDIRAVNS